MAQGKTLAKTFIAALYVPVVILAFIAVGRGAKIYDEWKRYKASTLVAINVLEDPINQYDPLLGWKHIPSKSVPMDTAFPGEGITFQVNQNGFRGVIDYDHAKPKDKKRIIAVGDSFTFGNTRVQETWPAFLERRNEDYQIINMGASAYGIDQMFLWYREDGAHFKSELVICAVIEDNFWRSLKHKWVSGHGRPRFRIKKGELVLTNVPVPRRVQPATRNVHSGDLFEFLTSRRATSQGRQNVSKQMQVPFRVLKEFKNLVETGNISFLLVFLPTMRDLEKHNPFANYLRTFCVKVKIRFLDLTDDLKAEARGNHASVFRQDGHYNAKGNSIVAKLIWNSVRSDEQSKSSP